ncbi:hypothetical protein [Haloechinothrix halophila]|uniref:hypothetical protein n=1 Tax=Haloechinothrix halophila TaxID=1069073 RepID=UPI0012F9B739|nr:hypothetical protein [Haloechinothrix halophila]
MDEDPSGLDAQAHDPSPFRDLPVLLEAELLEQAGRPGLEVGTALLFASDDLLGIGLDESAYRA